MPSSARSIALVLLLTAAGLAGCLDAGSGLGASSTGEDVVDRTRVVGPDGAPVAHAAVTALGPAGAVLAATSADADGVVRLGDLPAATVEVAVSGPGLVPWRGSVEDLPPELRLDPRDRGTSDGDDVPVLAFQEATRLGTEFLLGREESCDVYNCGASEPVLEIAGDGTIFVSGVCCIGESPPIWYSEDGGDSFQRLPGDVLRDSYGIEGDFAIDDAGNLYFSDISVASAYFASWTSEEEHRWTVPAGPFVPIVDRPWVRAGAEDQVFFLYNTGTSTMFYTSSDGGLTWTPRYEFPAALGNIGQGPTRDHLWVAAGGVLYESEDAGVTWSEVGEIPQPSVEGHKFLSYSVPVVDEAGHVWLVSDWVETSEGDDEPADTFVWASRYDPDGTWHGPFEVSAPEGTHHLPWPAAGADGTLAIAWYGTPDDEAGPNSVGEDARWFVEAAVSVDAASDDPSFQRVRADPLPVHEGPMDRKLLDFLQTEIAPDGSVHIAFAQDRGDRPDEVTEHVRSLPGLDLAPDTYPNGP